MRKALTVTFATLVPALAIAAACGSSSTAPALPTFDAAMNGANERPNPVTTNATGTATIVKDGATYTYTITYSGLSSAPTGAHIHGPGGTSAPAGVLVPFPTTGAPAGTGTLTGTFTAATIIASRGVSGDSLDVLLRSGNAYVNVHSTTNPGGEIRGQLTLR